MTVRIGICADLTAHIQYRKMRKLLLDRYGDFLVTTEEVGVMKPASAMFDLAVYKSGCQASDSIYVSHVEDKFYAGARDAGVNTALYSEEKYPDFHDFFEKELKPWVLGK